MQSTYNLRTALLESILDGIREKCILLDEEANIRWMNKRALVYFEEMGYLTDGLGYPLEALLSDVHKPNFARQFKLVLEGKPTTFRCNTFFRKELLGESEITLDLIQGEQYQDFGVLLRVKELDAAAYVQKKSAIRSKWIEQADNSFLFTDVDGRIEWANHAFFILTGYSLQEILGKTPWELLSGQLTDPSHIQSCWQSIMQGEPYLTKVYQYTREGKGKWLRFHLKPFVEHELQPSGYLLELHDITDQLKEKVSLEKLLKEQKSQNDIRNSLVNAVSNELKSPLLQALTLLSMYDRGDISTTDLASQLKKVHEHLDQNILFTELIRQWTHDVEGDTKEWEEKIEMVDFLVTLCNQVYGKRLASVLSYNMPRSDQYWIRAHKDLLKLVFRNLIDMALRYTSHPSQISIQVSPEVDFIGVAMTLNDHTMPELLYEHLFELDHTLLFKKDRQILSLGLNLCKSFIEKTGGKVLLMRKSSRGLEIRLLLPKYH